MPPRTNASLGTSLTAALGAIKNTQASVKAAAAQVYSPPGDQTSHPGPVSGPAPGQSA